jgi:hypothetical protein
MNKPPCPVCVAEVVEIRWEGAYERGTDVITLQPCGHELKSAAMERYRERMAALQES